MAYIVATAMLATSVAAWRTAELLPFGDVVPLIRTTKGHLVVRANANGVPVWLMVDTGATATCLTSYGGNRLKLKPTGRTTTPTVADGRRVKGVYHGLSRLSIGRCTIHRLEVPVADLESVMLSAAERGIMVDGVLGADLLQRFNAVLDYNRHELRLLPWWAADVRAMQGEWVATALDDDGTPPEWLDRKDLGHLRLTVRGDLMTLNQQAVGGPDLRQRLDLQPEYTPKRWASREIVFDDVPVAGEDPGTIGLYELTPTRLKFLISTEYINANQLPKTLTAKVPKSGFLLFTFRRPVHPAAALLRPLDLPGRLARWSGWDAAVVADGTLTATNPGRKLRVVARPDGDLTVGPLRP